MRCPSRKFLVLLALAGALCFSVGNAQYSVKKCVIGGGGLAGVAWNNGYKAYGTLGQFAIGIARYGTGESRVMHGFWPEVTNPITGVNDYLPSSSVSGLVNFPNPFNNQTTIRFNLPGSAMVSVKLFDASGSLVKEIFNGFQEKGEQNLVWSAEGAELASGSYMLVLNANPANMVGGDAFVAINERIVMVLVK